MVDQCVTRYIAVVLLGDWRWTACAGSYRHALWRHNLNICILFCHADDCDVTIGTIASPYQRSPCQPHMSRTRSCQDALLVGRTHCSFAVMAYILIRSRSFASLPHTPGSVRGISESTGSRNFTRRALVFPALDLCDNVPAPFANWTRTTSVPDVRNSEMIGSYPSSKVISINLESVEELEKVYSATDLAPLHQLARSRKEPTQVRGTIHYCPGAWAL